MGESAKGSYYRILVQDQLTELGWNLKFADCVIKADDGPLKGSTTPMVDLGTFVFIYLNTGKIHLNNCLPILTSKNYMSRNMYVLPINECV